MKSMKIKTYSVTKASSKEKKKSIEIMSNVDPKKQTGYTNQSDLNKLIKSPSLNISSKLDCKGNRLININLFDKPIKNNFVESKDKPCNLKSSNYFSSDSKNEDQSKSSFKFNQNPNINNINIKLNFNSEVINNNIKISRPEAASSVNSVKSSFKEFVSPKNREKSKESNEKSSQEQLKNYYSEILHERDKLIENLKNEVEKQKIIISQLSQEIRKLKNCSAHENQLSELKEENHLCQSTESINSKFGVKKNEPSVKINVSTEKPKLSSYKLDNISIKDHAIDSKKILFKPNINSTSNFRKSNLNSLLELNNLSNFSSSKQYCPKDKDGRSIEEALKSTARALETQSISSNETKNKSSLSTVAVGDFKELLRGIKVRTHRLLEKYYEKASGGKN